jgi:general secretion pathway protein J
VKRSREAGVTLVETMIALAILAAMMVVGYTTIAQSTNAKRHFSAQQDRYRAARIALLRMSRDLAMAYVSGNEDRSQMNPRTYFVGEQAAARFSTLSHMRLYADANESDQTVVSYYLAPDPEERGKTSLFRREARRPWIEKIDELPGETDLLFRDIKELKLTYFDTKNTEWKDSWNTQQETGARMPDRVKIELVFIDDNDKEIVLGTQTRVQLQEALQFYAN